MNIVLAHNDRPESHRALDWTLTNAPRLADTDDLTVHVVLVGGGDSPANPNYTSPALETTVAQRLTDGGITHVVHSPDTDAASQIVDLAHRVAADLVVIGTRRRSATMKLLLGSQVQRVMLDAPCPVVTVKPELGTT